MEFICAKCNNTLEKSGDLLVNGCSNCGSKVFKTKIIDGNNTPISTIPVVKKEKIEEFSVKEYKIVPKLIKDEVLDEKRKSELDEDNIPAIKLREKGIYDVNLDSLFRDKKSDPIILSSKQGIYRIEIFPSKE
ncbi:MAG: Zn-ribbon containing protein [Candidatus Thorarchaeota archaeon]